MWYFTSQISARLQFGPIAGVAGLFVSPKQNHYKIGDVLLDRVTGLSFRIVDTMMLNDIPHARLRCQAPGNNATKTIALGALEMTFSTPTTADSDPAQPD